MIHRLFETDAFEMLARGIPRDRLIVALDIGAHVGAISTRIREVFPNSRVFSFEPAGGPFAELEKRASHDQGICPVRMALGDRDGEIVLRETANPLLTSVLPPTERTREGSFGAAEVVAESRVPMARLETWAQGAGVDRVDLIKLDVQGYELGVLRGAGALLGGVLAVYAEAHVEPAYEGAATFSEIDLFLRGHGLVLHQIHEVTTSGDDLQTLQVDGLWVRGDLLEKIRRSPLESVTPPWARALLGALTRCAASGLGRVALYGAGTHTRSLEPWLGAGDARVRIVAVIDDDPSLAGGTVAGLPVIGPGEIGRHGVEGVILSTDMFEPELWKKTRPLRRAGVPVFRLYGPEIEPGE